MSAGAKRESIERALLHHEQAGVVRSWSPPEPGGRSTWRVTFAGRALDPVHVNTSGVLAVCEALAAAERVLLGTNRTERT